MTDRHPLWDQTAERSIVGAVVADDRCIADVAAIVQPEDFRYAPHREIFAYALKLHARGEPVDLVTLGNAVRQAGHTRLLGEIAIDVPGAANVEAYARVVADWSRRRAVVSACQKAIDTAGRTESGELAADLASRLEAASERTIGESLNWHGVITRMVEEVEQAANVDDDGVTGVRTGIPMIDGALGGLCRQRLIVLAARPSIGKTALANQIAVNAARDGVPGGICSLEMGEAELGARAMAYHCRANFTRLLRGRGDALDAMVRGMRQGDPKTWPLHLDTSTYSLAGIEARITSWKRNHDIRFAIVDHIGLIEVEGNVSTYDRVSLVSRRLKKLAKRLDIAIIAVAQLNRALEKERRKPTLADLRDSGNIEQDIDVGVFLHVDPDDLEQQPTRVHIGVLKNRTGRRGWAKPLMFDGACQRFFEPTHYDDEDLR
ncbi:DnaB-like helicase C-terminal domain-containing protein [Salinisphaera sp. T31B1]|uniref:replicative DNA helicase n=1 Tax=Salinisphaera sp. T31B1 TaxID=727963 RepID=UPI0033428C54